MARGINKEKDKTPNNIQLIDLNNDQKTVSAMGVGKLRIVGPRGTFELWWFTNGLIELRKVTNKEEEQPLQFKPLAANVVEIM